MRSRIFTLRYSSNQIHHCQLYIKWLAVPPPIKHMPSHIQMLQLEASPVTSTHYSTKKSHFCCKCAKLFKSLKRWVLWRILHNLSFHNLILQSSLVRPLWSNCSKHFRDDKRKMIQLCNNASLLCLICYRFVKSFEIAKIWKTYHSLRPI